jgi:hypothetical protein
MLTVQRPNVDDTDRRATLPPAHFHRNPPGRSQLAVFRRCSLDRISKIWVFVARRFRRRFLNATNYTNAFALSSIAAAITAPA